MTFAGEGERHQKSSVGSVCVAGDCSHSDIQHLETLFQRWLVQKYKQEKPASSLNFSKKEVKGEVLRDEMGKRTKASLTEQM